MAENNPQRESEIILKNFSFESYPGRMIVVEQNGEINIVLCERKTCRNTTGKKCVHVYDIKGNEKASFSSWGQGPGEVFEPEIAAHPKGVQSYSKRQNRLVIWNGSDETVNQYKSAESFESLVMLTQRKGFAVNYKSNSDGIFSVLNLVSVEDKKIKLEKAIKEAYAGESIKFLSASPPFKIYKDKFYFIAPGIKDKSFELFIFDSNGKQIGEKFESEVSKRAKITPEFRKIKEKEGDGRTFKDYFPSVIDIYVIDDDSFLLETKVKKENKKGDTYRLFEKHSLKGEKTEIYYLPVDNTFTIHGNNLFMVYDDIDDEYEEVWKLKIMNLENYKQVDNKSADNAIEKYYEKTINSIIPVNPFPNP